MRCDLESPFNAVVLCCLVAVLLCQHIHYGKSYIDKCSILRFQNSFALTGKTLDVTMQVTMKSQEEQIV